MATITISAPSVPATTPTKQIWKTGLGAGVCASFATTAVAALASAAAGVSLKIAGASIPLAAFAQLTLAATIVGTVLAFALSRRARRPRHTFVVTTLALTVASFVPDAMADAGIATRSALVLTHMVAAAIVIPALTRVLSEVRSSN